LRSIGHKSKECSPEFVLRRFELICLASRTLIIYLRFESGHNARSDVLLAKQLINEADKMKPFHVCLALASFAFVRALSSRTTHNSLPVDSSASTWTDSTAPPNRTALKSANNVSWPNSDSESIWLDLDLTLNSSSVDREERDRHSFVLQIGIGVLLGLLTAATAVGNIFVIAAIWLDKNLQSAQNCLVLSLAMADLTVAALVMPLATAYEVQQRWALGSELCTFWTLVDVFSCTASILHLLAIALDR
jgi:hypothetical protein